MNEAFGKRFLGRLKFVCTILWKEKRSTLLKVPVLGRNCVSRDDYVQVRWDKCGLIGNVKKLFRNRDAAVPIAELSSSEQEVYFHKMIDAVVHHLIPPLVTKLVERLQKGATVNVGSCSLVQSGIAFRTGVIFHKDHFVPWRDVETQSQNGQVYVINRRNRNAQVSMSAKDTDNAVILPILCAAMRDRTACEQQDNRGAQTDPQADQKTAKRMGKGWLFLAGILFVFGVLGGHSSNTLSSGNSLTPPLVGSQSIHATPSFPLMASSESKTSYRVPSYATAELERDVSHLFFSRCCADFCEGCCFYSHTGRVCDLRFRAEAC